MGTLLLIKDIVTGIQQSAGLGVKTIDLLLQISLIGLINAKVLQINFMAGVWDWKAPGSPPSSWPPELR